MTVVPKDFLRNVLFFWMYLLLVLNRHWRRRSFLFFLFFSRKQEKYINHWRISCSRDDQSKDRKIPASIDYLIHSILTKKSSIQWLTLECNNINWKNWEFKISIAKYKAFIVEQYGYKKKYMCCSTYITKCWEIKVSHYHSSFVKWNSKVINCQVSDGSSPWVDEDWLIQIFRNNFANQRFSRYSDESSMDIFRPMQYLKLTSQLINRKIIPTRNCLPGI